ncbi:hypothetical protein [Methylobacterium frigidaeris]|uniref:CobQ/CobB/MinD/ParA nucleotide binding domain-containing protein n=1 Tax=Methylobacterium frigidaeris TaxID=2038277 RepID=A0AA37HJE3_9HYPH|nr:hypothetical protein [Methylobacterium frigidaeris]PIK71352.1 hypothetical protein CS379_19790 [Methylobacterium frigidaeris]GJD66240.1 hypothetical protein MPEAHAMD_6437 [Methylobacterium frigidaeris]
MKIVTMLTEKGGSGKTTLTRHLAVAAIQDDQSAACLDADPMGGLRSWGDARGRDPFVVPEASQKPVHVDQAVDKIRDAGADYCFIDTAGALSAVGLHMARIANLVLIPLRPTADDVKALWPIVEELKRHAVNFAVVISAAPTTTRRPTTETLDLLEAQGVPVAPAIIHQRQIVPDSGINGLTALETEATSPADAKAVDEFKYLWTWAKTRMAEVPVAA